MKQLTKQLVQTAQYIKENIDPIDFNELGCECCKDTKQGLNSIITKMNSFISDQDITGS